MGGLVLLEVGYAAAAHLVARVLQCCWQPKQLALLVSDENHDTPLVGKHLGLKNEREQQSGHRQQNVRVQSNPKKREARSKWHGIHTVLGHFKMNILTLEVRQTILTHI